MNTYCSECDLEFNYYDYELLDDSDGTIRIEYTGRCPCCHKKMKWIEKYQFVETTWVYEIK